MFTLIIDVSSTRMELRLDGTYNASYEDPNSLPFKRTAKEITIKVRGYLNRGRFKSTGHLTVNNTFAFDSSS